MVSLKHLFFVLLYFYLSQTEVKGVQKYNIQLSKKINDTTLHQKRLLMSNEKGTPLNIMDVLLESAVNYREYSFAGQHFSGLGYYVQSIGGLQEKPKENKYWFIYELDSNGKHIPTDGLSAYIKNNSHYVFQYKTYDFEDHKNATTNWLSQTTKLARSVFKWFKNYAGTLI